MRSSNGADARDFTLTPPELAEGPLPQGRGSIKRPWLDTGGVGDCAFRTIVYNFRLETISKPAVFPTCVGIGHDLSAWPRRVGAHSRGRRGTCARVCPEENCAGTGGRAHGCAPLPGNTKPAISLLRRPGLPFHPHPNPPPEGEGTLGMVSRWAETRSGIGPDFSPSIRP